LYKKVDDVIDNVYIRGADGQVVAKSKIPMRRGLSFTKGNDNDKLKFSGKELDEPRPCKQSG
jgi:hypothetical protein